MRLANVRGRASVVLDHQTGVDVHDVTEGAFPADTAELLGRWDEFQRWTTTQPTSSWDHAEKTFEYADLGPVVAAPRQIFAIGLNYGRHRDETGFTTATEPVIFTKFASSLSGAHTTVTLPSDSVDWEAELVVVIGKSGRDIPPEEAWDHIAGLTLGQDLSDRAHQFAATPPQFSMAKSFRNFSPVGPFLVTPDEFPDPDDIELGCVLNGEPVQRDRSANMIRGIPALLETLSGIVELAPGDLVFTGTPAGVGMGYDPPRYLRPGDELVTWASGIGEIRQRFRARNA
ncbi:fumarylacetoacetate hydrolase family protein [Amycolatopsis pithecellobii]|uniref:Fumarylacetoacetate hydrolase n=1 Tax=Amycolatopsis pithecellobii TaxID=664692 RepID=A0A6N7YPB1_9PSEU|nr:fumarylacetoacetate hydrolase family protein [Amycolatopsis pithecellobii]MTD53718.1 fumarylacetoacetate hydrolase [Amycolatopsis pithecellobii]